MSKDGSNSSELDGLTNHDDWMSRSTPILLTACSKNFSVNSRVDSRLVCLTANMIEEESRVPYGAASVPDSTLVHLGLTFAAVLYVLLV